MSTDFPACSGLGLTGELSEMFAKSAELQGEIKKRLGAIGFEV